MINCHIELTLNASYKEKEKCVLYYFKEYHQPLPKLRSPMAFRTAIPYNQWVEVSVLDINVHGKTSAHFP